MEWTLANVVIQTVAGVIGANLVSTFAKEFSFGIARQTLVGALAGGLSGALLQTVVARTVTAAGDIVTQTAAEQLTAQCLAGAAAGAVGSMVIGFFKHSYRQDRQKNP